MRFGRIAACLGRLRGPDCAREPFPPGASVSPLARGSASVKRHVSIPLLYAALASLYIVISTLLVAVWLGYAPTVYVAEIIHGLGLVAVTTLLLWAVLFREARSDRLEELTFRGLIEHLPDAVFVLSLPERRIIYANPGAERLFGYARTELVGRTTEILHVGQREFDDFDARGRDALAESGSYLGELMMRRKDGRVFPTRNLREIV